MMNRLRTICKRLWKRLQPGFSLNRSSLNRLLVTILLGNIGVAASFVSVFATSPQSLAGCGTLAHLTPCGIRLPAALPIRHGEAQASRLHNGEESRSATLSNPVAVRTDTHISRLTIALDSLLPERYFNQLLSLIVDLNAIETDSVRKRVYLIDRPRNADAQIRMAAGTGQTEGVLYRRFLAPVVPFATVQDDVSLEELKLRWQGNGSGPLIVDADYTLELEVIFGEEAAMSVLSVSSASLPSSLEASANAIAIVPFAGLTPVLKVLRVNGVNILSNTFDAAAYPLAVVVAVFGMDGEIIAEALRPHITQPTNRSPNKLTTLIMTGVTAMARITAVRMDTKGYEYPAAVIAPTLRLADITHISNEVPFLEECVADPSLNNMVLCSNTAYWATLEAIGTDIVGLSGNHINDFGRDGARQSIGWYRENQIPIYGSGLNEEEACEPLTWIHNGNRFAFIAALASQPRFARATEDLPGACYYYTNKERLFSRIAALRGTVDVIAVELQYEETYNPYPTYQQVQEFRELREAGADLVTGVQSHVPQALEPYGYAGEQPGVIVYGLGNLFFDQMWSWQTRTTLMARHTIYGGQVLSTEILTAVIEDHAQPRWTTEAERGDLLRQIFNAAPAR